MDRITPVPVGPAVCLCPERITGRIHFNKINIPRPGIERLGRADDYISTVRSKLNFAAIFVTGAAQHPCPEGIATGIGFYNVRIFAAGAEGLRPTGRDKAPLSGGIHRPGHIPLSSAVSIFPDDRT